MAFKSRLERLGTHGRATCSSSSKAFSGSVAFSCVFELYIATIQRCGWSWMHRISQGIWVRTMPSSLNMAILAPCWPVQRPTRANLSGRGAPRLTLTEAFQYQNGLLGCPTYRRVQSDRTWRSVPTEMLRTAPNLASSAHLRPPAAG